MQGNVDMELVKERADNLKVLEDRLATAKGTSGEAAVRKELTAAIMELNAALGRKAEVPFVIWPIYTSERQFDKGSR